MDNLWAGSNFVLTVNVTNQMRLKPNLPIYFVIKRFSFFLGQLTEWKMAMVKFSPLVEPTGIKAYFNSKLTTLTISFTVMQNITVLAFYFLFLLLHLWASQAGSPFHFFFTLTVILRFSLLGLMNSFVVLGFRKSSLHIVACVVASVPAEANIGIPSHLSKEI